MSAGGKIKVTGLRELRRELKAAGEQFPKELQQTNKAVVTDLIVPGARAKLEGVSPRAGSRAVGTIRALASGTRAQVALGTAAVPWAVGKNFGSIRYRQFPPHLGQDDYALYRTIREKRGEVIERYGAMLEKLTNRAFPD